MTQSYSLVEILHLCRGVVTQQEAERFLAAGLGTFPQPQYCTSFAKSFPNSLSPAVEETDPLGRTKVRTLPTLPVITCGWCFVRLPQKQSSCYYTTSIFKYQRVLGMSNSENKSAAPPTHSKYTTLHENTTFPAPFSLESSDYVAAPFCLRNVTFETLWSSRVLSMVRKERSWKDASIILHFRCMYITR